MAFLPFETPADGGAFQIVATVGPASIGLVRELAAAGATAFRLNASHSTANGLTQALARIRDACPDAPIGVDLQGAKMRLGVIAPRAVAVDERVAFSLDGAAGVPLPHPEFFLHTRPGDTLSVDDGRLRLEVLAVGSGALEARALNDGALLPRKGVNLEQHPIELTDLAGRDREACEAALRHGVEAFAFSFMADGEEAAWLRRAAPGCRVIGKIERRKAVDHLAEIGERVDVVWICRGDLGAQIGPGPLARFVAALDPGQLPAPVLMAGQVIEHLTDHAEPTRSEACHLYDLVARGYAGIVLSDETATGRHPVHAVSTAAALISSFRA